MFCTITAILSLITGYESRVGLPLVYLHIFLILRNLVSVISKQSDLYNIYNVLMTQTWPYLKSIAFLLLLSMIYVTTLCYFIHLYNSTSSKVNMAHQFGLFTTWIFSNDWLELLQEYFQTIKDHPPVLAVSLRVWVLLGHTLYTNMVFRYFFAVVIQGYTKARSTSQLLINDETLDPLLQAWCRLDPLATGCIEAGHLLRMLIELKHPLSLLPEDLYKALTVIEDGLKKVYPANYPFHNLNVDIPNEGMDKSVELVSRAPYLKSLDGELVFTVPQYFLLCRHFNVNVYVMNNKK